MMGYNESVVTNLSISSRTLNNKYNDIAYNQVCESVATVVIILAHVTGKSKPYVIMNNNIGIHQHHIIMKYLLVSVCFIIYGSVR